MELLKATCHIVTLMYYGPSTQIPVAEAIPVTNLESVQPSLPSQAFGRVIDGNGNEPFQRRIQSGAREMAQRAKCFATKPGDLSSIPGTHIEAKCGGMHL